ncbi:hypothetical protein GCM10028787_31620 [Brachybacterium horti]
MSLDDLDQRHPQQQPTPNPPACPHADMLACENRLSPRKMETEGGATMASPNQPRNPPHTPDEFIAFADGALGAAGHEVTDPAVRALNAKVARGEITADEAAAQIREHYGA